MLQRKSFDVPDYHSEFYWITVGWPQRIALAINATETRLAQQRVENDRITFVDLLSVYYCLKKLHFRHIIEYYRNKIYPKRYWKFVNADSDLHHS